MAKIKVRFGSNEIEVDSRDFYLDNQTVGQVIEDLSRHMGADPAADAQQVPAGAGQHQDTAASHDGLGALEDAEAFEPEFDQPRAIEADEIRPKLMHLESSGFFDSPRTVGEAVAQLRESGWAAGQLDVSKALAQMASNKEISKNSEDDRMHYFVPASRLVS